MPRPTPDAPASLEDDDVDDDASYGAEIKLYESTRERRRYEDLADFYAVLKTTEKLEKAYARDAIRPGEYEAACLRLISQFKASEAALRRDGTIASADAFIDAYRVDCPRARERLIRCGVPATTLSQRAGGASSDAAEGALRVAECVQHFITAMDALKLEQRAVDEVQPLVADLVNSLTRVPNAPCPVGRQKLGAWLVELNAMRAAEEISEDQARQLAFDLDAAYSEFHRSLRTPGSNSGGAQAAGHPGGHHE